jgi:hypothetical protein
LGAIQAQCNYSTIDKGGVTVKQFAPMPIGGNSSKQVAFSISNVNGKNLLMLTIRFRYSSIPTNKQVTIYFSNGKTPTLSAIDTKNDFIGSSEITHLKFNLSKSSESMLLRADIASVVLNGKEKINATMYQSYVSDNLKCLK